VDILVLPGDGIGPEITEATLTVLRAADRRYGLGLTYTPMEIGFAAYEKTGTTLPDAVMDAARARAAILVGPISHMDYPPRDKGGVNVSAALRVRLDLYANIRPARTRPGVPRRGGDMDIVIVRECTEGMYPDRNMHRGSGEFMPDPDTALSLRKITRKASTRIARRAFEIARGRRKKVAAIHKANNFILTDGLFLECVRAVATDFPDVAVEELIVDATAALLVRDPGRFDTIVSTNFYCDILSDLASELCGGLGLAGAVNANDERCAAQAQHGSAPDIQGKGIANPSSLILSAAMLLDWAARKDGRPEFARAAAAIESAVDVCVADPSTRTRDLGGSLGTEAYAARVADALR
jgi:isocitrate/isopropylmalate dehydrogenase